MTLHQHASNTQIHEWQHVVTVQGVTCIKYCTDGVLLREMMEDPLLNSYRSAELLHVAGMHLLRVPGGDYCLSEHTTQNVPLSSLTPADLKYEMHAIPTCV